MKLSRTRLILLFCAAFTVAAAAQQAVAPNALKASGFVNDFARVLDPASASALEQRAAALNQALKVQVAMVTVATTGSTDIFDYSLALAQHWGVGAKTAANGQDKDTGLLILLAVHDHKYYTQVGYGLEPYITDADVGSWMRDLRPQLRASDFGAVFGGMLDQIQTTLAARMPGAADRLAQLPAVPVRRHRQSSDNGSPAGGLILIGFLLLVWILGAFASRGGRGGGMGGCLWPLIFMNMGGGGFGGGGGWGGGFGGGGGGGGGFGGFGGGGFGGGGAGGSW